ncbi:hypothetical protein ACHAXT_006699 [Thalassiosira profunda]
MAPRRPSTHLRSTLDKDRIKKAGAGITTQAPGDLCFYDPEESGKLQGTGTLVDRIAKGAAFSPSSGSLQGDAKSSPTTVAKPKQNVITTNLTELVNGELESRFGGRGRSQY